MHKATKGQENMVPAQRLAVSYLGWTLLERQNSLNMGHSQHTHI